NSTTSLPNSSMNAGSSLATVPPHAVHPRPAMQWWKIMNEVLKLHLLIGGWVSDLEITPTFLPPPPICLCRSFQVEFLDVWFSQRGQTVFAGLLEESLGNKTCTKISNSTKPLVGFLGVAGLGVP